MIEISAWH